MTEPARRPARRPGPGAVLWGSVALFAVLLALLTYQLSAATDPSLSGSTAAAPPVQVRKVMKRRIVTTVVPTPGTTSVSSGPATSSSVAAEPESEPVTTSAS